MSTDNGGETEERPETEAPSTMTREEMMNEITHYQLLKEKLLEEKLELEQKLEKAQKQTGAIKAFMTFAPGAGASKFVEPAAVSVRKLRGGAFDRLKLEPEPEKGVARTMIKEGEIANIFDFGDPKHANVSKKHPELLLYNDILVAAAYLDKKCPIQECATPTKIMWLSNILSARDKEKLGDAVESDFRYSIKISGPLVNWVIGFKTLGEKSCWQNTIIGQMGPEVNAITDSGIGMRKGSFQYESGGYDGEWINGLPNGTGKYVSVGGATYTGYWNSTHLCGFGQCNGETMGWRYTATGDVTKEDPHQLWVPTDRPTERDFQLIMSNSKTTVVGEGTVLIEQGKRNTRLMKLLEGELIIEKTITEGEPPVQLATINEVGRIIGETAAIKSIGNATATVRASTKVKYQEIDVGLLNSILASEPGIAKRFFLWLSKDFANKLRAMDSEKQASNNEQTDSNDDPNMLARSSSTPSQLSTPSTPKVGGATSPRKAEEDLLSKFGIDSSDLLIKQSPCTLKAMLKRVGKLYLFSNHLVFDFSLFGYEDFEVFPLCLVSELLVIEELETLKLEYKGKKYQFVVSQDFKGFSTLVTKFWEESSKAEPPVERERKAFRKKESLRPAEKKAGPITGSSGSTTGRSSVELVTVEMGQADWNLLFEGAVLRQYKKGEVIIQEGRQHQCIYQIAGGCCDVVVNKEEGPKHLVTLKEGSLLGEMTFLDPDDQKATASVIAGSDDCQVYIVEGNFIHMLMVAQPHFGAKFYSFVCSILARRYSNREGKK